MDEKKKYGIFRIEKVKLSDTGAVWGRAKHAFREFENTSFDPELTKQNECFLHSSASEMLKAYKDKIKAITTDDYKPAKNSVGIYECIFTSTAGAIPKKREKEFVKSCWNSLCDIFGEDNILAGACHRDETTVHTHWFVVPIYNTTSTIRRTREEKATGTCRTVTRPQLNATHWTGGPAKLRELQDTIFQKVFNQFGLERGETNPEIKKNHQRNQRSSLMKKEEALQQEKVELQEKAETIQETISKYEELHSSDTQEPFPYPRRREGVLRYALRIKPYFDSLVDKTKELMEQLRAMRMAHTQELSEFQIAAEAESKRRAEEAVEAAVKKVTEGYEAKVTCLKAEVEKERTEKQKWYEIIFNKFMVRQGFEYKTINKGLKEAYTEANEKLAKWERMTPDELIALGNQKKNMRSRTRDYDDMGY